MSLVITPKGAYFLADTHVRPDPSAEEIADVIARIRGAWAQDRLREREQRVESREIEYGFSMH